MKRTQQSSSISSDSDSVVKRAKLEDINQSSPPPDSSAL